MFKRYASPLKTFKGYKVVAFEQGRTRLLVSRLSERIILFIPHRGIVGVFLPSHHTGFNEADLMLAWEKSGCPDVAPLGKEEVLFLGKRYTLVSLPYAGYNDAFFADNQLHLLCKGAYSEIEKVRIASILQQTFLKEINAIAARYFPQLPKLPTAIILKQLRGRVLGQCTRKGEIRIHPKLMSYPPEVVEETLVHELCHLEYFDHSPAFWQRLTALYPSWLKQTLYHYL